MPASGNQASIYFPSFSPLFDISSDLPLVILLLVFHVCDELFLLIPLFSKKVFERPTVWRGFCCGRQFVPLLNNPDFNNISSYFSSGILVNQVY